MGKRHSRRPFLRFFLKGLVLFILLVSAGILLYCGRLSYEIEKRFSGRRWSIPSRVYSDTTLLYPGQDVNRSNLERKLRDLGYRVVRRSPGRKGEMRFSKEGLHVFLNDLKMPSREREGFPVRITLQENRIGSIAHLKTNEEIPLLELEPEPLMLFFGPEREQRRLISITQVPRHVVHAVLAAEDARFYTHFGIDPRGILRALLANLQHARIRQGGSTITQQLAKNYFLTPERTLSRKLKEMLIALILEARYEKDEILEIYLNEIYLGQKGSVAVNGLGEASFFYFGKPVEDLAPEEGAVIAGLIRAPNLYSPYVDKARCKKRRNAVLQGMLQNGWITRKALDRAAAAEVKPAGFQSYDRKAPYFADYLSRQLETLYSPESLSRLGLSIYTTLDTQVQKAAEQALERGLRRLEKRKRSLLRKEPGKSLQGAVLVMQPQTGYILAMVGGRDYSVSQFNRVTQAMRQPGSAFKPFVFLCGLDQFTPASRLSNAPIRYLVAEKPWSPDNFTSFPGEEVSLRTALAHSVNRASVDLAMKVGLDPIIETASAFRFSTPLKPYPSLALGAFEVVPLDLARAYCAFAADGMLPYPLSLKDITDEQGKILDRRHMTIERVTSPEKAFLMSSLLRSVVTDGTARSLKDHGVTAPVAGKTGTTDNYRDAWFVGYTPNILALVWVGFDDGTPIEATGSSAALPIWADLMRNIPRYLSGEWFRRPPGVVERAICSESGQLAVTGRCPETVKELFLERLVPVEECPLHRRWNPLKRLFEEVKDLVTNY